MTGSLYFNQQRCGILWSNYDTAYTLFKQESQTNKNLEISIRSYPERCILNISTRKTHVSKCSSSRMVCTGRQPSRGCLVKYFFERNLFFSTLVKSRTSSPEVVCNREAVGKCSVVHEELQWQVWSAFRLGKTIKEKKIYI